MNKSITIITATFNSASTLRSCLDSVSAQHASVEHLIIDGGSKDDTISIANTYSHVSKLISEPDKGVYDAMNKGITLATGDIIGILNSDDFYASRDVLSWVAKTFEDTSVDCCYGDLLYVDATDTARITRSWKSGEFNHRNFYWGWMAPHPTFFVRREVYEKYGMFSLNLGSAADYELMLRFLLKHKISAAYIPKVLVKMRSGGVSNVSWLNRLKANRMDRYAWTENDLKPYLLTTYLKPLSKIKQFFVSTQPQTGFAG